MQYSYTVLYGSKFFAVNYQNYRSHQNRRTCPRKENGGPAGMHLQALSLNQPENNYSVSRGCALPKTDCGPGVGVAQRTPLAITLRTFGSK